MAMSDATKRKSPEPETVEGDKAKAGEAQPQKDEAKKSEGEAKAPSAAAAEEVKIAVAKPAVASSEPDAKRLKATPPDAAVVRKQVEYYLSDDNLKFDKFFHEKISANSEGWLELSLVLSCNKMKAMRATKEDVISSLKDSKIEIKQDSSAIRRPSNLALPKLESRPQPQKKSAASAHDGGVLAVFKAIPEEQSWMQIKEKLRAKLPDKVQLWFVSEVSDKNTCIVAAAPFEGHLQFFDDLELELGGSKIKAEVAQGDLLQQSLKILPKHIREKREKEARKKQKERNRPIVVGKQRFVNVSALRTRTKEILNSRSDGEQLKCDSTDYMLIKSLLAFHPKGEEKSKGMVGIKVARSTQGESRCFWMVKDDGKEEDFSAQKCLSAIEANPPYVEVDAVKKGGEEGKAAAAPAGEKKQAAPAADAKKDAAAAPAADEKKEAAPAAEEKKEAAPAAEDKKDETPAAAAPVAEEKKEEAAAA